MCRLIRVHVLVDAIFIRETSAGDIMHVPAYFRSDVQDIDIINELDLNIIISDIDKQIDNFNSRGSGSVMEKLTKFIVCITKFRPLHRSESTFVTTPRWLANKGCVANVENNDNKCFL